MEEVIAVESGGKEIGVVKNGKCNRFGGEDS
jgi:hypothetical protein